ncbi:MAG: hypothetical protein VX017_10920, partial [Pseudomonadota bacterium]|nr:hypothetical protein [Pseudomonadota bacterium]
VTTSGFEMFDNASLRQSQNKEMLELVKGLDDLDPHAASLLIECRGETPEALAEELKKAARLKEAHVEATRMDLWERTQQLEEAIGAAHAAAARGSQPQQRDRRRAARLKTMANTEAAASASRAIAAASSPASIAAASAREGGRAALGARGAGGRFTFRGHKLIFRYEGVSAAISHTPILPLA